MPKDDHILRDARGGYIIATSDSNRESPDYLQWAVAPGMAYGIITNSPEARKFLEDTLRQFRQDASRREQKKRYRLLREIGERDALAGKSIDAFRSLNHKDVGLENTRARRRFRLTESMRAEYEIGYRAGKAKGRAS